MNAFFRFASTTALLSCASMAATPVIAAELPHAMVRTDIAAAPMFDSAAADAHDYRRWHRRHHDDGIDAGDVLGGLLVVGAIAAVASAVSKSARQDDYRNRDYRDPNSRYPDARHPDNGYPQYRSRADNSGYGGSSGLSRAVDSCTGAVSRNGRVDTIHSVDRDGDGWRVEGQLSDGAPFTCSVGRDGRVDRVDFGGRDRGTVNDRQWSNDRYAQAWQQHGDAAPDAAAEANADATPAYPGGPIGNEATDDGRYSTAQQPDFGG